MTRRQVTVELDLRPHDLPEGVKMPNTMGISAHITVESLSEDNVEDLRPIATAMEVAAEEAAARKLRERGYTQENDE